MVYKVYTGPTIVQTTAARLRNAGFSVYLEGTEHVYLTADSPEQVLAALGSGFSHLDVRATR
jgi:hypothetical protein